MGDPEDILIVFPIIIQEFILQILIVLQRHVHASQVQQDFLGLFLVAADDYRASDLAPFYSFGPRRPGDTEVVVNRNQKKGRERV